MQKISKALPRPQITPQYFKYQCEYSQSPERHGMKEANKNGTKQEYSIEKEVGPLIIF